jgi:hypothetical protein
MQAESPGPLSPGSVRGAPPNELNLRRRRSSGPADTAGRHDRNAGLPSGMVRQAAWSAKRHGPPSGMVRGRLEPGNGLRPCWLAAPAARWRGRTADARAARPAEPQKRPNRRSGQTAEAAKPQKRPNRRSGQSARPAKPHERPAGGRVLAGCAWRSPQRAHLPGSDPVGRVISLVFVSAEACARTNPECWSRAGRRWAWWPGRSLLRAASRRPR